MPIADAARAPRPPRREVLRVIAGAAAAVVVGGLAGCVVAPYYPPPGPGTYDRAYDAALGAMSGQGMSILSQDRAAGVIVGSRGTITLNASVRPQPDGTTRVEFNQSGNQAQDPNLVQRVAADYNRLMGR